MFKLNFFNPQFNSYLILLLSLTTLIFEVSLYNQIFFVSVLLFSILQNIYEYRFKNIISLFIGIIAIYIQFKLSSETLSKEFFLNLVLLLIFIKFSEAKNKNDYFFFNFTTIFLSVSSLIYGQDFLSSMNSIALMILSIIHLYVLNQQKIIKLNLKYLGKYLFVGIIILSFIAIIYFLFPRYEIKIKLFETTKNNLGIPDQIELGSFSEISNNDEKVFIFNALDKDIDEPLYFRVKVFDLMNNKRTWVSAPKEVFNINYRNNYKITKIRNSTQKSSRLIIYPNEKNWLPILKNFYYDNNFVHYNFLNETAETKEKIIKKTPYTIKSSNFKINFDVEILNFYKKLPGVFSQKLINWSTNLRNDSSDNLDYLNKLMKHFANGEYFYSLSPMIDNTNNYEKFFFDTKTGYCEYYSGMFAILARLQGIPTRLVTGYMGGNYNELGNFYTFKQSDAHTWVESYVDGKGWVRFDPTQVIPQINIVSFNNVSASNMQDKDIEKNNLFLKPNMIKLYYDYFDYIWTNKFQDYNQESRDEFLENSFQNIKFNSMYLFIILTILIFIKPFQIIFRKKLFFSLLFNKIRLKKNILNKSFTHQELFEQLSNKEKINFIEIFNTYERLNFAKDYKLNYRDFFQTNYKIIKFYLNIN